MPTPVLKKPIAITSESNTLFKVWRSLNDSRGIKKEAMFLLGGNKLVSEIIGIAPSSPDGKGLPQILAMLEDDSTELPEWLSDILHKMSSPPKRYALSHKLFVELDTLGLGSPLLALKLPPTPAWDPRAEPQGLEVLCAMGDPQNVGALLRSAEAFGASQVVLLKEAALPFHPKAARASAGAALRVPLAIGPSLKDLSTQTSDLVLLDTTGVSLTDFVWPKNLRLVIGEEGQGLPENLPGERVRIPMRPSLESLNAVVAASIALYEYSRSRN